MSGFLIALTLSACFTLILIRTQKVHSIFSLDGDFSGPQKIHTKPVPRIGGVAIFIALILTLLVRIPSNPFLNSSLQLIVCALPVFLVGFLEDLTKKIGVKIRLIFTGLGAWAFIHLFGYSIINLDIVGSNIILAIPTVSIIFTIFAITGLTNAYNIIDGFNGLASMVAFITLLAIAYIAYKNTDLEIFHLSLIMAGAILGFFIWNYPNGLIFLGDGGAYLIGFWISGVTVLLICRHPTLSPWLALMVNGYPILETIFSIYRRSIHRGKNPGDPDGIHFHTLLYRRLLRPNIMTDKNFQMANARTSPYLWILATLSIGPAMLWSHTTIILIFSWVLFISSYLWIYRRIVRFQTPKWLNVF